MVIQFHYKFSNEIVRYNNKQRDILLILRYIDRNFNLFSYNFFFYYIILTKMYLQALCAKLKRYTHNSINKILFVAVCMM